MNLDALTLFGLFAVGAMLVFYALEERSPQFIASFAAACVLASAYGFLQGAWPFGVVELVWSIVALRRWMRTARRGPYVSTEPRRAVSAFCMVGRAECKGWAARPRQACRRKYV